MSKTMNIIRGKKDESYSAFHQRIREIILTLKTTNPARLLYTITMEKPPKISVIPFSKEKLALISISTDHDAFLDIIQDVDGYAGSFRVTEALPIYYDKDWPDGQVTAGVCLLTLFRKKKNIDYETFIDRWHNGHTPLTLKIHPIYHYNRNEVSEVLGNPPVLYDGIVEEHCRTRQELINPFKFFAKSGFAPVNMIKTYFDVNSFIDYGSIETYLVSEYHVIS